MLQDECVTGEVNLLFLLLVSVPTCLVQSTVCAHFTTLSAILVFLAPKQANLFIRNLPKETATCSIARGQIGCAVERWFYTPT